jgi:hypothetical protein
VARQVAGPDEAAAGDGGGDRVPRGPQGPSVARALVLLGHHQVRSCDLSRAEVILDTVLVFPSWVEQSTPGPSSGSRSPAARASQGARGPDDKPNSSDRTCRDSLVMMMRMRMRMRIVMTTMLLIMTMMMMVMMMMIWQALSLRVAVPSRG